MEKSLSGHYDYCHFTYRNKERTWKCCCDFIKGYLEFQETKKEAQRNIKYTNHAKASP